MLVPLNVFEHEKIRTLKNLFTAFPSIKYDVTLNNPQANETLALFIARYFESPHKRFQSIRHI